ncbi:Tricalbin-2 [Basidiobolus ranarum]|uniref:Tricalbin-2 n=1 Tax=Basidiobolus ranarum TaxID=34480 RepID=A0ABR2W9J5_9FUNG
MSNEAGYESNQPVQSIPSVATTDPVERDLPNLPTNEPNQPNGEPEISTEQRVADAHIEADKVMSDSKAPVHSFNPNDTPEEKAKKAREAPGVADVTANNPLLDGPQAKTIISDATLPSGNGKTSESEGAVKAAEKSKPAKETAAEVKAKPKKDLPPPILGWRESNDDFMKKYAGQEWQNYIAITVLILGGFLVSRLYFGFGWCLIVIAFGTQYYANSVQRHRRNVRDDITRQLAVNRLFNDSESTEWLNSFVSKFWLIYEPVLSAMVVEIGDGVLAENTPGFLDSLRLSHFTLGTKAPRVDSVKTINNNNGEKIEMEWEFSFTPNDTMDMTKRELETKTNPKICLEIRVGKGIVGAGMPILVEDFAFKGRMRIGIYLMSTFPHVKTVDVSFMEPPVIDYVLKPLGGETFGFDIAHIPGLQTFIRDQTNAVLGPMMYAPNVFTLDVEQIMSGVDMEAAVGVLKITIRSARNLKNVELIGMSDPYVILQCNNRAELARTSVKYNTLNPVWDETYYVLLHNISDNLSLEIFDKEDVQKDRSLGTATFDLSTLNDTPEQTDILGKVIREGGKESGELLYDLAYYPVIPPVKNEDGTESPVESNSGILKVFIHQAKDLSSTCDAYGTVKLNGNAILKTQVIKKKNNPLWEKNVEMFISDKKNAIFEVDVMDERGFVADPVIGKFTTTLDEALNRDGQNPWYSLDGSAGKVRMTFVWRPVVIKGGVLSAGRLAPPIGVVRLDLISGLKLKNTDLLGKADPYIIVSVANKQKARTEYIEDSVDPTWNETHFIGVRNPREIFVIEVYDWDKFGKDSLIGSTSLNISELLGPQIAEGQFGEGPVKQYQQPIKFESKERGTVCFNAHFYPTNPITTPQEEHAEGVKEITELEAAEGSVVEKPEEKPAEPIDYTQFSTGLLSVLIGSTKETKKQLDSCFAEVLINNNEYNIVHRTEVKKKVTDPIFNEECEAFVQEALFTKISVLIRQHNDSRTEIARVTLPVTEILDILTKTNSNDSSWYEFENHPGKIQLAFKFTPVNVDIDEALSVTNKGVVAVKIIKANNLKAADSSGLSDPFVRVKLNDEKVFKTKTIKKSLNPEFDEEFSASLMSRNQDVFLFEIFDWNQFQSQELLGRVQVNAKDLEPSVAYVNEFPLTSGEGTLTLSFLFTPEHVGKLMSDRKGTIGGTIGGAALGGAATVVGGTLGAGKTVVGGTLGAGKFVVGGTLGAGKSVVGGAKGLFGLGKKKSVDGTEASPNLTENTVTPVPIDAPAPVPAPVVASVPMEAAAAGPAAMSDTIDSNAEAESDITGDSGPETFGTEATGQPGTITIFVLEGSNLPAADSNGMSDPYIKIRWGRKVVHKTKIIKKTLAPIWNESFTIPTNGSRVRLHFSVKDHNLLQDTTLGEYELDVWDRIHPASNVMSDEFLAPLANAEKGQIKLRIEFTPDGGSNPVGQGDNSAPSSEYGDVSSKKFGFSSFRKKNFSG